MANKICRVKIEIIDGANVLVREDGLDWPPSRIIESDAEEVSWLMDGPTTQDPVPSDNL